MNSFELNKIAGALLAGALIMIAVGKIADFAVSPTAPEKPVYVIDTEAAKPEDSATASTENESPSLGALLAAADPAKGAKIFKKCAACHTSDAGGGAKIGPNLYAVLGRAKGSVPGFSYSNAMAEKGGDWTYADMDTFLTKPKAFVKGTKMSFGGLKKPADRASLIAYLRSLGSDSIPLPAAD